MTKTIKLPVRDVQYEVYHKPLEGLFIVIETSTGNQVEVTWLSEDIDYVFKHHEEFNTLSPIELQPSEYHEYDPSTRGWILNTVKAKKDQSMLVRQIGARLLNDLASPYAPEERDTWAIQAKEAEAYLVDNSASTTMIDAIATARGISKDDLVLKIMENNNLFRAASGMILGKQQALLDAIEAATTLEEIQAAAWN